MQGRKEDKGRKNHCRIGVVMEIKISFLGIVDNENLVKELTDIVAKYGGVCIEIDTTPNIKDAD